MRLLPPTRGDVEVLCRERRDLDILPGSGPTRPCRLPVTSSLPTLAVTSDPSARVTVSSSYQDIITIIIGFIGVFQVKL